VGRGLVLGHCFTCSRHTKILSNLSRDLANIGYQALRFDFSGNGGSQGVFAESTYSKQIRELQCAADYLKSNGVSEIIFAGHSMGGASALLAAAQSEEVIGVIALAVGIMLLNPGRLLTEKDQATLSQQGKVSFSSRGRSLTLSTQFFEDAARYELKRSIQKIHCPVLLVYGGKDTIIDPKSGSILHEANPGGTELFKINNADHMFSAENDRKAVINRAIAWAQQL